uniref:Uncharacterized protein n=1 Tax=Rhizophora mucronata TaxID=61149 RepID=A0A2P2P171_RHIMU
MLSCLPGGRSTCLSRAFDYAFDACFSLVLRDSMLFFSPEFFKIDFLCLFLRI